MPNLFQLSAMSTIVVCAMASLANVMLARRYVRRDAALALALGFLGNSATWLMVLLLPGVNRGEPGMSFLLLNALGALGLTTLWCGFWLRAGYRVNHWLAGGILALWLLPVAAVMQLDLPWGSHIPFAAASATLGVISSMWAVFNKPVGPRNAGDWALIAWFALILPVSLSALAVGVTTARDNPDVWLLYANPLPALYAGVALFTLLGFALDAIRDSTELAMSDALTGLLNRRAFDREMHVAVARAERFNRGLSLIVLDIDHFKLVNDRFSHPAGDTVLRAVARIMEEQSRRVDVAARIGGDEFALILPDTPIAAALRLAQRLCHAVNQSGGEALSYSASLGVAAVEDVGTDAQALYQAADGAMYAAKAAGRNCIRYAAQPDREIVELIGSV